MKEINCRQDVELLVNSFYDRVVTDQLLAPFFEHMNFEKHMPKMIHFWSFVLLDEAGYTTDVTKMHMHMEISQEHFDRWIYLFHSTVDEYFTGEKANLAKERAVLVGWTIASKLKS